MGNKLDNYIELKYEKIFRSSYKKMFYLAYNMTKDYFLAEDNSLSELE